MGTNHYGPPSSSLRDSNNEQDEEYAGFWIRLWACIIDTILMLLIMVPLLLSVYGTSYFSSEISGFIAGPANFFISWIFPAFAIVKILIYKSATRGYLWGVTMGLSGSWCRV